jgi:ATP-dependent helicase/nuclease subunit B
VFAGIHSGPVLMAITRRFFDWHSPALPQIVSWLCGAATGEPGGVIDLSETLMVFPGRYAGRRFLELLTAATGGHNDPPDVITPEELPERLYEAQRPFATDVTQQLVWAEALRGLSHKSLESLLRNIPDEADSVRWLALGRVISSHHSELAADGLDFGDVAARGATLPGFEEQDRWGALREAQVRYLSILDGLGLWDKQTARLFAIKHRECRTTRRILLIGTVDLNQALRKMLDLVADRVTACIHAPEELAERFDEHGCLRPESWETQSIDLDSRQVRVVDGPAEQAREAVYQVADFGGRYSAEEVLIGVADEKLVPRLRTQFAECGIATRPVVERKVLESGPARLLEAVADLLESDRTSQFATLARHPDIADWLAQEGLTGEWLAQLDEYAANHLQPQLGEWLGDWKEWNLVKEAHGLVRRLLQPLRVPPRSLSQWRTLLIDLLRNVYRGVEFRADDPAARITLAAIRKISDALDELAQVPDSLSAAFSAVDAIRLLLDAVSSAVIPPRPVAEAIEILGWLELPLHPAPAVVVTTFNEGFVPSSLNGDLFLPNNLRQKLGVLDNRRRYARDGYALSSLLHSRKEVRLIVGRRDDNNDPLKPSRLLFAADPETIARRVQEFYGDQRDSGPTRPRLPRRLSAQRTEPAFIIPRPLPRDIAEPLVSVTSFKSFLTCPYRYYLGYGLKLKSVSDADVELDALGFGNLLHDVLKAFGESKLKDSSDPKRIQKFLDGELDALVKERLGTQLFPAVQIQIEQLRRRIAAFVPRQVELQALGWRIQHVEVSSPEGGVEFPLGDGRAIRLTGRIDRVDYNAKLGEWMLLDYKSTSDGKTPDQTHRRARSREWIDLQLPLYRHIAAEFDVSGTVRLGYFLLPDNSSRSRVELAGWTEEELDSADSLARDIGRRILAGEFWPPTELSGDAANWDSYTDICQTGCFDAEVLVTATQEEHDDAE